MSGGADGPTPRLSADFRRLWSATLASNLADGIVLVSLPLAAVSLTTDPLLVASVAVAGSLPPVLLVLFAGVAMSVRMPETRQLAPVPPAGG